MDRRARHLVKLQKMNFGLVLLKGLPGWKKFQNSNFPSHAQFLLQCLKTPNEYSTAYSTCFSGSFKYQKGHPHSVSQGLSCNSIHWLLGCEPHNSPYNVCLDLHCIPSNGHRAWLILGTQKISVEQMNGWVINGSGSTLKTQSKFGLSYASPLSILSQKSYLHWDTLLLTVIICLEWCGERIVMEQYFLYASCVSHFQVLFHFIQHLCEIEVV